MCPLIPEESREAPKDTKGFDSPGTGCLAHVSGFPTELVQDRDGLLFGSLLISADKHRGLAFLERGVDHKCIPNTTESFYEVDIRETVLELFHQGFISMRKILDDSILRRNFIDRIGGIDNGLAIQILRICFFNGIGCRSSQHG